MPAGRVTYVFLGVFAGLLAGYYAAASLLLHYSLHSNAWDLGVFDQVVWNTAHGRWFEYSFRDMSYAGDHFQPILIAVAPFRLIGGAEVLLLAQALALAAATVPLFLAARNLAGERTAWAAVVAYGIGLPAIRAVNFDFHPDAFAPVLAFTGIWALTAGRTGMFAATTLALLSIKEDFVLLVLGLCWIAWFGFGTSRTALACAVVAVAYAAVVNFAVMPALRDGVPGPIDEKYGYLGSGPGEVLGTIITRPDVVAEALFRLNLFATSLLLLGGVAFLPLLVPRLLPAAVPITLLAMLADHNDHRTLSLHHMLGPGVLMLTMALVAVRDRRPQRLGGWIGQRWPRLRQPLEGGRAAPAALALAAAVAFAGFSPLPPSLLADNGRFDIDAHARLARSFIEDIPADAAVSAQAPLVPHLSGRRLVFDFPHIEEAEYILVDRYRTGPVMDRDADQGECLAALPALGFRVVREEGLVALWRREGGGPGASEACGYRPVR
jgi:hypothetical protein